MATGRSRPSAGTPAVRALESLGVRYRLHAYEFAAGRGMIALEAAAALNVAPARILKTLMVVLDAQQLVAALVPADRELDLKALAGTFGAKRAALAERRHAERATGYVKGGISPFGRRQPSPVVVDVSARQHASVFVNGGRRGLEIELAPRDLIRALDARVAAITRQGDPR